MLKLMRKHLNQAQKGFTLIELLIVVAIIGILAAIAIPNLITAQRRARYSRSAGDTKSILTQAMVMTSDNNMLAATVCAGGPMPACLWTPASQTAAGVVPTVYMAKVNDPWAPTAAPNYQFNQVAGSGGCAIGPGCVSYALWTVGSDAASGGAWTGLVATTPTGDDLGNSTEVGCAFGLTVGIANPC